MLVRNRLLHAVKRIAVGACGADNGSVGHGWNGSTKFGWVTWVTGQYPWPTWPILHCTHPVSHVIFWFMENQQRQSKLLSWLHLLVAFHNLRNSVARDEQATSETHRYPREGPNSVEILGKINCCELNLLYTMGERRRHSMKSKSRPYFFPSP